MILMTVVHVFRDDWALTHVIVGEIPNKHHWCVGGKNPQIAVERAARDLRRCELCIRLAKRQ